MNFLKPLAVLVAFAGFAMQTKAQSDFRNRPQDLGMNKHKDRLKTDSHVIQSGETKSKNNDGPLHVLDGRASLKVVQTYNPDGSHQQMIFTVKKDAAFENRVILQRIPGGNYSMIEMTTIDGVEIPLAVRKEVTVAEANKNVMPLLNSYKNDIDRTIAAKQIQAIDSASARRDRKPAMRNFTQVPGQLGFDTTRLNVTHSDNSVVWAYEVNSQDSSVTMSGRMYSTDKKDPEKKTIIDIDQHYNADGSHKGMELRMFNKNVETKIALWKDSAGMYQVGKEVELGFRNKPAVNVGVNGAGADVKMTAEQANAFALSTMDRYRDNGQKYILEDRRSARKGVLGKVLNFFRL
jgi:hypothetical protein